MKLRQTPVAPTLIQLQTERTTKESPQDDLKKRFEVMKLYISRNNTSNQLIKNLQDINDKYSPSYAQLDHQMSSSSQSSSNLKEDRQTTASGLSKSVSYRSFIRDGLSSSRQDRYTSKGKTENNTNQMENNLRSPIRSRNLGNQIMRGVKSEKSLGNRDQVNSFLARSGNKERQISNFESPSRDIQAFMTKSNDINSMLKQGRESKQVFQGQPINVGNFLSPRCEQSSQLPNKIQQQMRVKTQPQQQQIRSPLGNIFPKAERSTLSYQNDSTVSTQIKQKHNNSLFPPNSCTSGQSGFDFRVKEAMTTQGDDNNDDYDRQDTSGDDLYHTATSSQQNKNHFYNPKYKSNIRANVSTTIPRSRDNQKVDAQLTNKLFNSIIHGDKDKISLSRDINQIASSKMIMFLTNKVRNNSDSNGKLSLLKSRNIPGDQNNNISKPINFPFSSQQKKRIKNLKLKTEPEGDEDDENNMQFHCLYDPPETTETTKEQNGFLSQDTFNIFGQAHDYARSLQLKLQYNLTRLQPSKDVIRFTDAESKNIHHKITTMNVEKNLEMLRSSFIASAEATISTIGKIYPLFEDGMQAVGDRNALDEVLTKINSEASKGKNTIVAILCLKSFAKISKLNKNFIKAIELYKQCKNLADKPIAFRYRMNSYKNIGFCFSQLKSHEFAMFYYGKMLRIAWYLGDRDFELQAYDLIGLQYFYQGKLDKAQYYHNKMIRGDYEGEQSDLRRLGISKIDNELKNKDDGNGYGTTGSVSVDIVPKNIQKAKQARARQDADNLNKSQDFYISSESEDDFELPFPTQSHQQKHQDESNTRNNNDPGQKVLSPRESQDYKFSDEETNQNEKLGMVTRKKKKNEPLFYHKDQYKLKQITDEANKNIRIGALEKKKELTFVMPTKQITAQSFKQIKGSTKTPYRLNHLSVNRELENYQCLDARVTKVKHFNFNEQMYDQYDQVIKPKIKNIFEDLRDNLLFAMANLEMLVQKQKYPSKRKVGICQLPYQNIEQQRQNQKLVFSTLYHDFSKS